MKYIGIDAHSSTCNLCIVDEKGREIEETRLRTNGMILVEYLQGIRGAKTVTFEECELSGWLYEILEHMEKARQECEDTIRTILKQFEEAKYLKSIPGIGDIQAAKIIAQVIDPRRFENKYKFYSYCGLVRHRRSSGEREYGSTKIWGNRTLKCVYKMVGHSILRGSSGLKKYYDYWLFWFCCTRKIGFYRRQMRLKT